MMLALKKASQFYSFIDFIISSVGVTRTIGKVVVRLHLYSVHHSKNHDDTDGDNLLYDLVHLNCQVVLEPNLYIQVTFQISSTSIHLPKSKRGLEDSATPLTNFT